MPASAMSIRYLHPPPVLRLLLLMCSLIHAPLPASAMSIRYLLATYYVSFFFFGDLPIEYKPASIHATPSGGLHPSPVLRLLLLMCSLIHPPLHPPPWAILALAEFRFSLD